MKVSINWLRELVNLNISDGELISLIPLRIIGLKETNDDFIELDMKGYNRADLLSMRGVAREVSAITDSQVNFTNVDKYIWEGQNLPEVKVEIQDDQLCPIYCVAKIEGLKVGESPEDIVKKLSDSGIRSIDSITDVTNLMMMEFGQTMHSFDAAKVVDETMIVRLAKDGEEFETLDGKIRQLSLDDLLIADPKGILSLSGIMGGKDSEITENTDTILLEVAIFDPKSIRKSSQKFGLYSEASKRIQHGLTKTNLLQSLDAAIRMYEEMGGKLTALTLVGDLEDKSKVVNLRHQKVNSLIGIEIPKEEVEKYLQTLGFSLKNIDEGWEVTVPYFRLDINIEEDLIEEVARLYGYEKIPAKPLEGELPEKIDQSLFELIYKIKKSLEDLGLTEVLTYSFYSSAIINSLDYSKDELVRIQNPISSETEFMRNHIWPNLVEVVGKNLRNGYRDIAIFEIGKAYYQTKSEYPEEYKLSLALLNETDDPIQELFQIFKKLSTDLKLEILPGDSIGESAGRFHPTRYIYLNYKNKPIGKIGEVHPRILNKFGIEQRVAILEFTISSLL